ncbi:membrane protein insertase YidC [Peptococcus simiae]|uniref:membrane protein insertase YidC n=1 Tax=Peptococcus simiae TaxID=1643805 RepID=UPI0039817F8A
MNTLVQFMTSVIGAFYDFTQTIGFPSYALAIILLGIVVRILLFPLSLKQMKSMLGMSEIQPELKEIQAKYASNREKMNEEMQRLYVEYEVNPMAGCLPILIQMPILYALFRALRTFQFTENDSFFWIEHLNDKDPYFILPVVLAVVMFLQQRLSMPKGSPMADNPSMKAMLYVMPVMMGVFALQFPAGLCVYWVTTSALMIFQQIIMNKQRKKEQERRAEERAKRQAERELKAKEERLKGHNPSKKKSKKELKAIHKAKKGTGYKAPSQAGSTKGFDPNNPKAVYRPANKKKK